MHSQQLREALIAFIVLHWTESCNVKEDNMNNLIKKHVFKTYKNENPCFNVTEVATEGHYPHFILHQVNVSNKSICTDIVVQGCYISHIDLNAFRGLVHLSLIDLKNNKISFLETKIFKDLKTLKKLILTRNNICSLNNGTFRYLSELQELHLSYNCIKLLNKDSFLGLVSLKTLNLIFNMIQKLGNEIFKYLISLQDVWLAANSLVELETLCAQKLTHLGLSRNYLKNINVNSFAGMKFLKNLNLAYNMLTECTLSYIRSLEDLNLFDNNLTHINKVMFAGLINLRDLCLNENMIITIDCNAFKDLRNLKELYLSKNKLKVIRKELFKELVSLNYLNLAKNHIVLIEEYAFADIISEDKIMTIDLLDNGISELSWTVFGNFTPKLSQSDLAVYSVRLKINTLSVNCKRSHCWLKHLEWKIFKHVTVFGIVEKSCLKEKCYELSDLSGLVKMCDKKLKLDCPRKAKWCMYSENNTCEAQCIKSGKAGGKLVIDGDVCPFQYYCKCSCPSCVQKCALHGKVHIKENTAIFGCDICNCQCDNNPNCWKKCKGASVFLTNGISGCLECKCKCPFVNCNSNCAKEGIAIIKKDKVGCQICGGCKINSRKGGSTTLTYVIVVSLFTVSGICLSRRCLQGKMECTIQRERLTILDILTKNLDPELAQQVKESWCDLKTLCVEQLLGNGQFGLVWSGTFEISPGTKYPAAIKVAKAEYKDVWTVQTNWNDKHELPPHFQKRPVQVNLDNQIIEDYLTEALIMKQFHHNNVLKIVGLSIYEEKPCIILPMMLNGDMKKYLRTNKAKLSSKQLVAFTLGVAKGMDHLAERSFVHCDLAARNCLLDADLVVKISDFGMTKAISDMEHYKSQNTEKVIPIKWMSIESVQLKKFTSQSDVWSYGVVLWEIFSYGQLPYTNIENTDVMKYLLNGHRLEKPAVCPENIYEVMLRCWNDDPNKRPDFNTIVDIINKIADVVADYAEVKET